MCSMCRHRLESSANCSKPGFKSGLSTAQEELHAHVRLPAQLEASTGCLSEPQLCSQYVWQAANKRAVVSLCSSYFSKRAEEIKFPIRREDGLVRLLRDLSGKFGNDIMSAVKLRTYAT